LTYLQALVRRYGAKGTFWKANPGVPRSPVRYWQIWNEPGYRFFYGPKDYKRSYPRLLKAAYQTVKRADAGAKVVISGLANTGPQARIWTDLAAFYRAGAKRWFDVLAIHPFGSTLRSSMISIQKTRAVMRRYHDASTPIWLTEFFYTASKGRIPKRRYLGLEVSAATQRRLLRAALTRFATDRGLGIKRVFWHPWATQYRPVSDNGAEPSFEYSGLVKYNRPGFSPTRLLSLYASLAARFEGCRKSSNAKVCRGK
jgi:hypothetical protein